MQIVSFDFIYSSPILVIFVSIIDMIAFIFLICEFIQNGNNLLLFLFLAMFFFLLIATYSSLKNPQNKLVIKYINEDISGNEINISKEQIINDILSGKITQNKNNLQVYSQEIPITEEEYKKLNKYKEQYEFLIDLAEKEYDKKVDVFYHIEYCSKKPYIIDEKEEIVFITMLRLFTNFNFRENLHGN